MKLVIKRKLPKRRIAHRPTKVEVPRVRYDRKREKQALREQAQGESEP